MEDKRAGEEEKVVKEKEQQQQQQVQVWGPPALSSHQCSQLMGTLCEADAIGTLASDSFSHSLLSAAKKKTRHPQRSAEEGCG